MRETGRAEFQSLRDPVTPEVRRHASGSLWHKHPGSPLEPGLLGLKRYSQGLKGSPQRRHVGEKPVSRLRMRCVTWVRLERAACAQIGGKAIILRGLAGRRSKVGGLAALGAYPSAGWLGSRAGGGGTSMLMPSPSMRGAVEVCAATMLPLMTSALPKSGIWFSSVPSLKFLRTKNAAPRSKFPEQDPSALPSTRNYRGWVRFRLAGTAAAIGGVPLEDEGLCRTSQRTWKTSFPLKWRDSSVDGRRRPQTDGVAIGHNLSEVPAGARRGRGAHARRLPCRPIRQSSTQRRISGMKSARKSSRHGRRG